MTIKNNGLMRGQQYWLIVSLISLLTVQNAQAMGPDLPPAKNTVQTEEQKEEPLKEKSPNTAKKLTKTKKYTNPSVAERLKSLDNLYVPIHWSDPATGIAIGGYDPIGFFEHERPIRGEEEFEYTWHGVAWRFRSRSNLNAFKRSPSHYAPVLAGYDAYSLSKGILTEGSPTIWAILEGRLYLFHNPVNRHLWLENKQQLKSKTRKNWSVLSLDLSRYKVIQK